MNFYSFDEIREKGSCIRFVEEVLGERVVDGRCKAAWRGGTNEHSVSVKETEWYDFSEAKGGGIIELCAVAKFGGDIQLAQDFLGGWLRIAPKQMLSKNTHRKTRYNKLIEEGYKEVARYYYKDEAGVTRHIAIRLEHPEKAKEFVQETPNGPGTKDVELLLYNLPTIAKSKWVVIVEGEKDADTLIKWDIPATTNVGGSKKWLDSYNEWFRDKDVVICRDNDDSGLGHAKVVARSLADIAKTIRIICPSNLHKGDVTDWMQREQGTREKFFAMIKNVPALSREEARWSDEELQLLKAKECNQTPFANTRMVEKTIDGKDKKVEEPFPVRELCEGIHERFIGFPRRIGESRLFDHDRDSGCIEYIDNKAALFAWIGRKSKRPVHWGRCSGAVGKDELFEGLIQSAIRYESISMVPDFPRRADVYYAYRDPVHPSENHECFNGLMRFFNPANEASRILLRALFAAPIYYRYGVRRPCWILDSEAGPGVGKTTIAELLGTLYCCSPIKTSKQELKFDHKELLKRVVSSEGRSSRILLVDNVTGVFDDAHFADMVTGFGISGKAPYGRGEETRPNNLTYIITTNSANINNDIASRSFTVMLAKPKYDGAWTELVMRYIEKHRYTILGDVLDMLQNPVPLGCAPHTRMPEFEQEVLRQMCANDVEYHTAIAGIVKQREEANVDEEFARQASEILQYKIDECIMPKSHSASSYVFIRTEVVERWLSDMKLKVQDLRNYAKTGLLDCIDKEVRRFPTGSGGKNNIQRSSGVMWIGQKTTFEEFPGVLVIGRGKSGAFEMIGEVPDLDISQSLYEKQVKEREQKPEDAPPAYQLPYKSAEDEEDTTLLPF